MPTTAPQQDLSPLFASNGPYRNYKDLSWLDFVLLVEDDEIDEYQAQRIWTLQQQYRLQQQQIQQQQEYIRQQQYLQQQRRQQQQQQKQQQQQQKQQRAGGCDCQKVDEEIERYRKMREERRRFGGAARPRKRN